MTKSRSTGRAPVGTHRIINSRGYVMLYRPEHPLATRQGYVPEHRMIAWDAGLFDDPSLQIHHRNGDKLDNRVANLVPMTGSAHMAHHMSGRTPIQGLRLKAKTHCPHGHPYSGNNLAVDRRGWRSCLTCTRETSRKRMRARRLAERSLKRA